MKPEWMYHGKEFKSEDIGDNVGFVYLITNTVNGKKYIGKKQFVSVTRRPPLKGKKRKRVFRKEVWQDYWGSSKYLKADIDLFGKEAFTREILSLHRRKDSMNFEEMRQQVVRNVLTETLDDGDWAWYNENIMCKFYRSTLLEDNR